MAASFLSNGNVYPGGKGKSFQHIINVMPPHERYIESHLGAGAVMRNKRLAATNIGIDLDERVIKRWRAIPLPVQVIHGDALEILPALRPGRGDLVYCDPPFYPATRRRQRAYRHDMSVQDHARLLDQLEALSCSVVLSGYSNELYNDRLRDWSRTQFRTQTHAGIVTESIWTNFEPGPVLHDYSYLGGCFRERERMRRRIGTLSSRLSEAPAVERNAALAELADRHPDAIVQAVERIR